jgi:hypothetical protein
VVHHAMLLFVLGTHMHHTIVGYDLFIIEHTHKLKETVRHGNVKWVSSLKITYL